MQSKYDWKLYNSMKKVDISPVLRVGNDEISIGMQIDQVHALLGEPSWRPTRNHYAYFYTGSGKETLNIFFDGPKDALCVDVSCHVFIETFSCKDRKLSP